MLPFSSLQRLSCLESTVSVKQLELGHEKAIESLECCLKLISENHPDSLSYAYTEINPNTAMSNPNGLLSQKVWNYLHQGRTLNDIFLRAAH